MCGICGVVRVTPPGPVDEDILRRMRDSMVHRGPDDGGLFISENVGLGHRRLSIIDLSGGHQPMSNADGSAWIVFNGEIYNFQDLRSRLEGLGHTFRTRSDTEVILQAYEAFGTACVEYLRGMFAFGIWDHRKRELLLARDRLGIKPLYYTMHDGTFLFASEIKAILQWPGVPREVDTIALGQYLRYRYVPGPRTMFRGISKLQPGHLLRLKDGTVVIRPYWDLPLDGEELSREHADRQLWERLEECVRLHLISDVPLGVFLSGGIDSSTITGLAVRHVPGPVQTFAVGYPHGQEDDETGFARRVADHFRTQHRVLTLDPGSFWDFLTRMVWFLDEPVADPAAVPLYFLAEYARRHVTVVLSGEGGDELLAGYGIYHKMLQIERLRRIPFLSLMQPLAKGRKMKRYLTWMGQPLHERYRGVSQVCDKLEMRRLVEIDGPDNDDFARECFERTAHLDPLRRMLYLDLKVWLPDDLLMKADRMTMATSVELRVPFLDHTLVEWAWRLPSDLKLHGATGKYLLRRITADLLPAEILQRPKQGFFVPLRDWLRTGLHDTVRTLLLDEGNGFPLLNSKEVGRLLNAHLTGREDLSEVLFTLAVLACWHQLFIAAPRIEPPHAFGACSANNDMVEMLSYGP